MAQMPTYRNSSLSFGVSKSLGGKLFFVQRTNVCKVKYSVAYSQEQPIEYTWRGADESDYKAIVCLPKSFYEFASSRHVKQLSLFKNGQLVCSAESTDCGAEFVWQTEKGFRSGSWNVLVHLDIRAASAIGRPKGEPTLSLLSLDKSRRAVSYVPGPCICNDEHFVICRKLSSDSDFINVLIGLILYHRTVVYYGILFGNVVIGYNSLLGHIRRRSGRIPGYYAQP